MADNKDRRFLVVAEIERTGFIVGYCQKYRKAVELANEVLLYGELFSWGEPDKIKVQLQSRHFRQYQIKGNQIYFDKGIYGSADGKYSVAVLPINIKDFCLEVFIKERENYSIVFNSEQYWEKSNRKYFDDFPSSLHKAN